MREVPGAAGAGPGVARRHELLAAVLERMAPDERAAVARAAARFTALAADAAELGSSGPLPL